MSGGMQATLRPYMERITELEEALRAKDAEAVDLSTTIESCHSLLDEIEGAGDGTTSLTPLADRLRSWLGMSLPEAIALREDRIVDAAELAADTAADAAEIGEEHASESVRGIGQAYWTLAHHRAVAYAKQDAGAQPAADRAYSGSTRECERQAIDAESVEQSATAEEA